MNSSPIADSKRASFGRTPRFRLAAAFISFALAAPSAIAQSEDPPATTPPEAVSVQGVVEVLNDVLREPFIAAATVALDVGVSSATVEFDVPAGRRLVVETISFQASTPVDQSVRVLLEPLVNAQRPPGFLAWQSSAIAQNTMFFAGTHPIRLRLDATEDSVSELRIRVVRSATIRTATFSASVYGYLVDR